jgi:hypothetical protein
MKAILTTIVIIAACSMSVQAQDIATSNLKWTANRSIDLHSSTNFNVVSNIITLSNVAIEFERGGSTMHFDVTGVEGTWTNVQETGSILFHVGFQNAQGKIVIERVDGDVMITIDMTESTPGGIKQRMIVDGITSLQ